MEPTKRAPRSLGRPFLFPRRLTSPTITHNWRAAETIQVAAGCMARCDELNYAMAVPEDDRAPSDGTLPRRDAEGTGPRRLPGRTPWAWGSTYSSSPCRAERALGECRARRGGSHRRGTLGWGDRSLVVGTQVGAGLNVPHASGIVSLNRSAGQPRARLTTGLRTLSFAALLLVCSSPSRQTDQERCELPLRLGVARQL